MYILYSGIDSRSDNGYWEVIVKAETVPVGNKHVEQFLKGCGRKDLIRGICREKLEDNHILHSTVEQRE